MLYAGYLSHAKNDLKIKTCATRDFTEVASLSKVYLPNDKYAHVKRVLLVVR